MIKVKYSITYEYALSDDDLENKKQTKEEDDQNFHQIEKTISIGKIPNNGEFDDLMTNNNEDG